MILTISLNPGLDITYSFTHFHLNNINRVSHNKILKVAGGKTLNVTRVIKQSGTNVLSTGIVGGLVGEEIIQLLNAHGVRNDFYRISGNSRNNITIATEGKSTEILEQGPCISENESKEFLKHLTTVLENNKNIRFVVMSGSLPPGLSSNYYTEILKIAKSFDVLSIVDTSGGALKEVINCKYKPYCIKPNETELKELFSIENGYLLSVDECLNLLSLETLNGIEWIIYTQGSEGAIIKHGKRFYKANIPQKLEIINPTGSGDSTIAGFCVGLLTKQDDTHIIKHAMAYGILNAMEDKTGYINIDNLSKIEQQIEIINL